MKITRFKDIPQFTCAGSWQANYTLASLVKFIDVGFIQFGILGGIEKQNGITGAINDENSVVFLEECNKKAVEIKNYIEEIILSRNNNQSNKSQSENFSAADEILKLKKLLDMGVLTQNEFDAKKKQLLGI